MNQTTQHLSEAGNQGYCKVLKPTMRASRNELDNVDVNSSCALMLGIGE